MTSRWTPRRVLTRAMPAGLLAWLIAWQLEALGRDLSFFAHHPGWVVALFVLRGSLYVIFLAVPTAVLVLDARPPLARDDTVFAHGAAMVASFLLVGLGALVPSGPALFRVPTSVAWAALVITVLGAVLAVRSIAILGSNFSFAPEARELVTRGPYRHVRHPVYLAELMMSLGVLIAAAHLTTALGEVTVIALQVARIRREERLLSASFPSFVAYARSSRYRLVPGLW
ncbi:MAG: hypothetical protein JWM85_1555 [Acidimicrobiaceae bacterium]|nr:hypothetical protein [Acidimicrobiaceae bacterium]